jgi:hypothetical protein
MGLLIYILEFVKLPQQLFKLKEEARANDAVDRLREVKEQLERERHRKEQQHDQAMRFALLVLIASIIGYAILRL